jgi:hypothetical protein
MELIHFTFQSFWHFIGVTIILGIILEAIIHIIKAIRK